MIIEISNTNSNEKICTRCSCIKKKADFCRSRSNNPQHEYSTCNKCSEKCKNKREKIQKEMDMITRKKTKLESNLNAPVPSISITLSQTNIDPEQADFSHPMNFELDDGFPKNHEDLNILQDDNDNEDIDNTNGLLYGLGEIQELISKLFQNAEGLNEPANLAFEIELNSRLIECYFSEFHPDTCDHKEIKTNFHKLVNVLLLPIEYRSNYYWEVQKIHLIIKKTKFTGCATAYLGCIQRKDRKWQRSENLPVK